MPDMRTYISRMSQGAVGGEDGCENKARSRNLELVLGARP